jgi:hypothetical protein
VAQVMPCTHTIRENEVFLGLSRWRSGRRRFSPNVGCRVNNQKPRIYPKSVAKQATIFSPLLPLLLQKKADFQE